MSSYSNIIKILYPHLHLALVSLSCFAFLQLSCISTISPCSCLRLMQFGYFFFSGSEIMLPISNYHPTLRRDMLKGEWTRWCWSIKLSSSSYRHSGARGCHSGGATLSRGVSFSQGSYHLRTSWTVRYEGPDPNSAKPSRLPM